MDSILKTPNFSAAILAGGKNSRFNGENKSFLKVENKFIIDRIQKVLHSIFSEIIIVTNNTELYHKYSDSIIVSDFYKETGPLGGIHAALLNSLNDNVFIVSCDMPFLNTELILKQIDFHIKAQSEITIPVLNNFKEPLHGIYNKSILNTLEKYIESTDNYKIRGLFELVNINYFHLINNNVIDKAFTNINHPDEYKNLINQQKNEKYQ